MEVRKIIGFGKSSFVVSLPKAWIEKQNLQKGDALFLEEGLNNITLKAQESSATPLPRKKVIQADHKTIERIQSEIVAAYLGSYDIIKIIGEDLKPHAAAIKDILHNLTGIELLEQDKNKIVAKDLLNPQEVSFPLLIRRVDNIVRSLFLNAIEGEDDKSLAQRDLDINRIAYLINRIVYSCMDNPQLVANLATSYREIKKNSKITNLMERIGDYIKRIARNMARTTISKKDKQKLMMILESLQKDYLYAMKAFHTNNVEIAYELELNYKKRMEECNLAAETAKDKHAIEIMYNLKAICSAIKNIARTLTVHDTSNDGA